MWRELCFLGGFSSLLAAAQLGFENEDVSDLIGIGGQVAAKGDISKVDLHLTKKSQRERMSACIRATRRRMDSRSEEVETTLSSLMAQAEPGMKEPTEEEAINQLFSLTVFACYEHVDNATISEVLKGQERLSEDASQAVFRDILSARRPGRAQVELYEEVIREEQARILAEMTPDEMVGALGNIGRQMSTATKAAYVAFVLAGLAAFGGWSLWRMTQPKHGKERSSKSWRQQVKAEARLERKRR
mmetsp:Transcript_23640/g.44656  ORF Transcript_23640/g.44656 Transcript_23640/m.44656 type:complete len:245 (+) Transcript_23640:42-776(+)